MAMLVDGTPIPADIEEAEIEPAKPWGDSIFLDPARLERELRDGLTGIELPLQLQCYAPGRRDTLERLLAKSAAAWEDRRLPASIRREFRRVVRSTLRR